MKPPKDSLQEGIARQRDTLIGVPQEPLRRIAAGCSEVWDIRAVLDAFRTLRFMDEMLYLRSGTLNFFNGIVGLTFYCDGSHYIPYAEFTKMDYAFWVGDMKPLAG